MFVVDQRQGERYASTRQDERGEMAGYGMGSVPPAAAGPAMKAITQWRFKLLVRDGKTQHFDGTVEFTVQ